MSVGIRKTFGALIVLIGLLGASAVSAQSPTQLELWVTNQRAEGGFPRDAVIVYDVGQVAGKPVLTTLRVLSGPATGLNLPTGILVTPDKLYVANEPTAACGVSDSATTGTCGSITIYDRTLVENSCTVPGTPAPSPAPTRVLTGVSTGLNYPFGIAINNRDGELYVANQTRTPGTGFINVYSVSAVNAAGAVNLSVAPIRTFGPLSNPSYIVFDEVNSELFVANSSSGVVTVHRRDASGIFTQVREIREKTAPDEAAPDATAPDGTRSNPFLQVSGLALAGDELFVAHGGLSTGRILVYRRTDSGTPDPLRFIVATDLAPGVRTLDDPTGLAVDPGRGLLFSGNDARTTSQGFISVFDRAAQGAAPPLLRYQESVGSPLFSPVGLALATRTQTPLTTGDYSVTKPPDVTVRRPAGGSVDVPVTLTIAPVGTVRGSVTVGTADVNIAPPPNAISPVSLRATTSPSTCSGTSCGSITLTFSVSSTTTFGTYMVSVATHGILDGDPPKCVDHPTSFNITVTADTPPPTVTLNVVKQGSAPGACTVTSRVGEQQLSCGPVCTQTFPASSTGDTTLTLGVTHDPEGFFSGWQGCSPPTATQCSVSIPANGTATVTAVCDRLVHLITRTDGTGACTISRDLQPLSGPDITCGNDCYLLNGNRSVTLTATPNSGSLFTRWTGCDSTTGSQCAVSLTDSKTVTATCDVIPNVRLTVFKAGFRDGTSADGTGIVRDHPQADNQPITCGSACAKDFPSGTTVNLVATPDPGSAFVGCTSPEGHASSCSVTLTASTSVGALFVQTPQEGLIARFYLYVFDALPPSPANLAELISAVKPPVPTLTGSALVDAFFDGPTFRQRFENTLTPGAYVETLFQAFLPRQDPSPFRQAIIRALFQDVVSALAQPPLRSGFAADLYAALLPRITPTPSQLDQLTRNPVDETLNLLSQTTVPGIFGEVRALYRGFRGRDLDDSSQEATQLFDRIRANRNFIENAFRCSPPFRAEYLQLFQLDSLGCS